MIKKVSTANRDEWKALRKNHIGGSDAASVVGLNPYRSAYALWAEKLNKTPEFEGNLATEVGTYLEEFVAKKFEEVTSKKVRRVNQSFLNDEYPFAIANIDRDIVGEDAGLEIKTTSEMMTRKFKGGEYPPQYYCQCVHYMAVTGKSKWYLAVLIGNRDFKTFTIERDEDEIKALMESEKKFWQYVQAQTPPPADGASSTTETITTIYPESSDDTVNITAYDTYLDQYIALGKQIKELKASQDEMANKVKAFMAEAGKGESFNYKVSWTSFTQNTFDAKRFAEEHSDMDLSNYYKAALKRTFRVTERK